MPTLVDHERLRATTIAIETTATMDGAQVKVWHRAKPVPSQLPRRKPQPDTIRTMTITNTNNSVELAAPWLDNFVFDNKEKIYNMRLFYVF